MSAEALKQNIKRIKEITREIYVFTNQIEIIKKLESRDNLINKEEKNLLTDAIGALTKQLKIINNSMPALISGIGFYSRIENPLNLVKKEDKKLIQISYNPKESEEEIAYTISDKERKEFLENLSKSNLSINQLKKKYSVERNVVEFGRPNFYAKISNRFFRDFSNRLIDKGYFKNLNSDLRKINSQFVLSTYLSMIFLSIIISFFISIVFVFFLLFYNVGLTFPFISAVNESFLVRFVQVFWIIFAIPIATGLFIYLYPNSESRSLGSKINQELPFIAVHMSAIATSGIEPVSIFKIILKSQEYPYTSYEFKRILNLVNFQGKDIVTALKTVSRSSPSQRLKELLDGLATTINSGGSMHEFLDKHADTLLFDYRLERERYTKISETMMDIYISIVIAAPMVLLMLFVIIGSTGNMLNFLGLGTGALSFLIDIVIIFLNIGFLTFLKIQQPQF